MSRHFARILSTTALSMKKTLLIGLSLGLVVTVALAVLGIPMRFNLQSTSPSGTYVTGLRFQARKPHALDGTLRLFVYHDDTEIKQQTSIPWGRDLAIQWKANDHGEIFVVEKGSVSMAEFQVAGSELKCIKGEKYLAADPYR